MYICMVFQTHTGRSYLNPFFLLIEEKRTYMGSLEKISFVSVPDFSTPFFLFTSPFLINLSSISACVFVIRGGVFVFCPPPPCYGMTSMTEMACATSPPSAFAAAAFGASSSSVRLRYQTVGPLYACQAGWATLPHSYYALDYCSPK